MQASQEGTLKKIFFFFFLFCILCEIHMQARSVCQNAHRQGPSAVQLHLGSSSSVVTCSFVVIYTQRTDLLQDGVKLKQHTLFLFAFLWDAYRNLE